MEVYPYSFNPCILVDSSTVICWTISFVILGMWVLFCSFYSFFEANSEDPDQMPHNVASDLGLHCLPMTLLRFYGFPGKNGLKLTWLYFHDSNAVVKGEIQIDVRLSRLIKCFSLKLDLSTTCI